MTAWRYPDQDVGGAQRSRRTVKQVEDRRRRTQREQARELQERVGRGVYPVREDEAAPRID
jgi:hypothetical protein